MLRWQVLEIAGKNSSPERFEDIFTLQNTHACHMEQTGKGGILLDANRLLLHIQSQSALLWFGGRRQQDRYLCNALSLGVQDISQPLGGDGIEV